MALSSSVCFISMVFRMIQAFAIFDLVYVMTGGGPGGSHRDGFRSIPIKTVYALLGAFGSVQPPEVVATVVMILATAAFVLHRILLKGHDRLL